MFADYHVHTEFSDDSTYPMEQVVKDAISMNMNEICFTDHVDYGIKEDWNCGKPIQYREEEPLANVDYPIYVAKIRELQYLYEKQINLKMGMEFGIQTHTISQYETLFQKYPFDFIILSIHQVEDKEFWTQDFQKEKSQEEYNKRYRELGGEIITIGSDSHNPGQLGAYVEDARQLLKGLGSNAIVLSLLRAGKMHYGTKIVGG